jgi:hypothetical protein
LMSGAYSPECLVRRRHINFSRFPPNANALEFCEGVKWIHSAIRDGDVNRRLRPDLRRATLGVVARLHLLFVQILARHVVFGHFMGANLLPLVFSGVFHARYDPCLERVAFLQQLVNTFRIDTFDVG